MTHVLTNTLLIALSLAAQAANDLINAVDAVLAAIVAEVAANAELLGAWLWGFTKVGAVAAIVAVLAANPLILLAAVIVAAYAYATKP